MSPLSNEREPIEEQPSALAAAPLPRWSLAASAGFHLGAILILVLLALLSPKPPPEPVLRVTLLNDGPGAAGAAGGAGGGGEQAAEASSASATESAEAAPAPAAHASDRPEVPAPAQAPQAAQAEPAPRQASEQPALAEEPPPPRRKPTPPRSRPKPVWETRPVAQAMPAPEEPKIAAAPAAAPLPGAPGTGSGPGGGAGLGTGTEGAGHGAIGDGPIEGPGDDYLDRLRRWLNRYKHYPQQALRDKQEGRLVVSFTILRDGTVRDPQIERSSGFPLLDAAALQMLRDASPVPPLPERYRAEHLAVDLPVEFSIGLFDKIF